MEMRLVTRRSMGVVPHSASPNERTRNRIAACRVRRSFAGSQAELLNAAAAEERLAEVTDECRVALEHLARMLTVTLGIRI